MTDGVGVVDSGSDSAIRVACIERRQHPHVGKAVVGWVGSWDIASCVSSGPSEGSIVRDELVLLHP